MQVSEEIIHYAFRYCLGRKTYAVGSMVDYLKEHWHELSPMFKDQILKEIRWADADNGLGDRCDCEKWRELFSVDRREEK